MIKRYILHIELHRRHMPRISFRRIPKHGERGKDGGRTGTFVNCQTCSGEGKLFDVDEKPPLRKPTSSAPRSSLMTAIAAELAKNLAQRSAYPSRPVRSDHTPRRAMDFNYTPPRHVELKVNEPQPEHVELTVDEPSEHVELKITEPKSEHVELKDEKSSEHVEIKSEDESPEKLELDYKLGNRKYVPSDRVWTHKAWYIVEKLEKDVLYLVREDVWEERQKKSEHVELKDKEENSGEVVVLNFE